MKIKLGKVLKKFKSKKGREVILRVIRGSDLEDLLRMINSIIREKDFILLNKKVTLKQEQEWLKKTVQNIRDKIGICVCAVINSKVIGNSTVSKYMGVQDHIGSFGITLMKDYREQGIGKEFVRLMLKIAKSEFKLKILILEVFETNKRALNLYKKMGFKEYGKLPKGVLRRGKYVSDIKMYKEL